MPVPQLPPKYMKSNRFLGESPWSGSCIYSLFRMGGAAGMGTLTHDLAYALRQMRKAPGFTLVAVITLALGIGANAAIFTLVHAILLRSLPVKNPSALHRLGGHEVNCCVMGGFQDEWDEYSYAL